MYEQSLLNRAALVLRKIGPGVTADEALRTEMAFHKAWSAVEKRQLVRAVQSVFKWWNWLPTKAPFQARVEEALRLQDRFDRNEADIKVQALAARAVPDWLASEMTLDPEFLRQLQRPASLWLRTKPGLEREVAASLEDCELVETRPFGDARSMLSLRYRGTRDLYRSADFVAGRFEIQDLASQAVGLACAPEPGETWWDTCAGEGGKTLHLSALMEGRGMLWASDRNRGRLQTLEKRAARAEVFNYRCEAWEGDEKLPTKTLFDGILVDAPCSGVGTWQRNPQARWTTRPQDVEELSQVQKRLLTHACTLLKPSGRLVYSVCTLTRSEGASVIEAFLRSHLDFVQAEAHSLVPGQLDANGMFIAILRKSP